MARGKDYQIRNWGEMDYNILLRIFIMLNFMDLISGVSLVCRTWRAACHDSVLWSKLDLSMLQSSSFNIPQEPHAWSDAESSQRLTRILKSVLNLSCGSVSCLIFHFYVFIKNEHLICASERTSNLKRLVLPPWNRLTVVGFLQALRNWEGLESLTIPFIYCRPATVMKVIGSYCKKLTELKLMCPLDVDFAVAIASSIPKLKVLSLQCTRVYEKALAHIVNKMEHLEVLNVSHCLIVEESSHPGFIVLLQELDKSIIEQASRLKQFFICQKESCYMCKNTLTHGVLMWSKYEEGIWRMDEAIMPLMWYGG